MSPQPSRPLGFLSAPPAAPALPAERVAPALDLVDAATRSGDLGVRIHATATRAIIHDPEIGFAGIFAEAKRSLGG